MYDWLIVGAGFAGSVLAERLASERNERVLIVDRRNHIGGNAYDRYDDAGILIHQYGPHIFHMNSKAIFDHLSQFTAWRPYEKFFRGYTRKQWGMDPSELDKSVTARVPTRTNRDDRYFTDEFQYMPAQGYTAMFAKMLDHPNITTLLGVDFREVK